MERSSLNKIKIQFHDFYQRHEALVAIIVFIAGFVFDVFTLGRIDDLFNLIQQATYLIILGTLLIVEIRIKMGSLSLSSKAQSLWQYHDILVHFLFGSLLSVYTIFYYTSASAISSFIFILLLAGLTLANEFPRFQKLGPLFRVTLFSICLLSYFSFFYPILLGQIGAIPFWLGFFSSSGVLLLIWKIHLKKMYPRDHFIFKHVMTPALVIHVLFLIGYYTSLIPPVPVALKKIGVYYDVEKKEGSYIGKHQRPWWNSWFKSSEQIFKARKSDKIVILLSIYSPAAFKDKIYLRWYHDKGNEERIEDSIPLSILGGREDGFRGFGIKQYYLPGKWTVTVETSDGRQVGKINFEVEKDESTTPREFLTDIF